LSGDSNHMTKSIKWRSAAASALFLIVGISALHAISLSGNVETDFVSPEAVIVTDGSAPDVGVPPGPQWGQIISGWDIKDFRFVYDPEDDSLYVGINFFGVAGDADGDGNPSTTSAALTQVGGRDIADLGSSEAIQIQFDWNLDEKFETIAGIPRDARNASDFMVASDLSPATDRLPARLLGFGTPVPGVTSFIGAVGGPRPDFEFKIPKVSTLPGFDASKGFNFRAYAGSFVDDGIGEDFTNLLHVDLPIPAPEPVAAPVVSLTELIVGRWFFNFSGTAAGEGGIARVEYKNYQRRWTRFQPANGTSSWQFKIRREGHEGLRVVIRAINNEGNASPEMALEIQP
jgi:hypothetical protein